MRSLTIPRGDPLVQVTGARRIAWVLRGMIEEALRIPLHG